MKTEPPATAALSEPPQVAPVMALDGVASAVTAPVPTFTDIPPVGTEGDGDLIAPVVDVTPRILVIDDEEPVLYTMGRILQTEGYEVDMASSGREGLELFRESLHDLVLTDFRLGDITGTDVLREVKQIRSRTAVIILTGYATTESAVEAVRLGASDYLTKPVRMSELTMSVRNQIATVRLNERIEMLGKAVAEERDKLRRHVAELTLLRQLADRMMSALSYREGFELILDFITGQMQADVALIYDLRPGEARLSASSHPTYGELQQLVSIINRHGTTLPDWHGPVTIDLFHDLLPGDDGDAAGNFESSLAVPFFSDGTAVGLIVAASRSDRDFHKRWTEFARQVAGGASEFLDRVKRSVERQQRMTSAIVEHTLDGLVVVDMGRRQTLLNPVARSLLEIPTGQEPSPEEVAERLHCNIQECWQELHAADESQSGRRTVIKHTDLMWRNHKVFLRLDVTLLPESSGDSGAMLIAMHDVTRERAVDEMKNKLISNISHELRTPTAVVKEFISLIMDGVAGDLNANQKQLIEIMKANIERLARLIENLLTLARADTGGFSVVLRPEEIVPLIETVAASLRPKLAKKEMSLTVDLPSDLPLVYADRDAVTQIVTNLIENARKYSPDNTEVSITALAKGNRIEIAVADQGYGIPPGEQENIFKRFHRLVDQNDPRFQEGVGLGLPLVKDLVTRHGGDIWVVSEVGKGSTFYFSLQTAQEGEDTKPA